MKTFLITAILFILSVCIFAKDDINFYGGCKLTNIKIIKNTNDSLIVRTAVNKIRIFTDFKIRNIQKFQINKNIKSELSGCTWVDPIKEAWDNQTKNITHYKYEYSNLKLLPVSIIAFILSYEYIDHVSDLNLSIASFKRLNKTIDVSESISMLESEKKRSLIIGITLLVTGLINTYFSLKKVQVKTTNNNIELSYKF